VFAEGKGTHAVLYGMPLDGPPAAIFTPARGTFAPGVAFNRAGTHAGMSMQATDEAPEAYVTEAGTMKPVRVSAANTDLPKQPLGETKIIKWKAKDGKEIEGLLTLPV